MRIYFTLMARPIFLHTNVSLYPLKLFISSPMLFVNPKELMVGRPCDIRAIHCKVLKPFNSCNLLSNVTTISLYYWLVTVNDWCFLSLMKLMLPTCLQFSYVFQWYLFQQICIVHIAHRIVHIFYTFKSHWSVSGRKTEHQWVSYGITSFLH